MLSTCLLLCTLAPQGADAPVVINEFQYDDSGTDDREYVELYNASASAIDISNWMLEATDPGNPDNNADYTIPAGTVLLPGGFWVMGAGTVPNVNQVVGVTDLWENSNETLILRDANGTAIDTVLYEANKGIWAGAPIEGQGVWGNLTSFDGIETSWSRLRDGYDTGNNGRDFRMVPVTPGTTNNLPSILPYLDNFDAANVGDMLTQWGGSAAFAYVIDPMTADANNTIAIPPSPAGGNAAIFWDNAGGGNHNMLLTDAARDVVFEAFVYFDTTTPPSGEREVWSVGIQGHTATYFNSPDPSGSLGFTANGDTGICWTYELTSTHATLYFVDNNDGGVDEVVHGQIQIQPGVNDGWQRLRLQASGSVAEGFFGGTFGQPDGTHVSAPIQGEPGGIYIGYREALANNYGGRPFTADLIRISDAGANSNVFGDPVPSTFGTPTINSNGFPVFGQSNFAITFRDMAPSRSAGLFIGIAKQAPPIDLTLFGAQPNSKLLVTTEVDALLPIDAAGQFDLVLPIPNQAALNGLRLYCQAFEVDANIAAQLPLAHTAGLELVIGN